jgi:allophanate hydrolase subunit 2
VAGHRWPDAARPRYTASPTLRILPGPHINLFVPNALELLQAQPFQLGPSSNRIGYRLEGVRLAASAPDMSSLPVFAGVIQVPPDGAPILLMADAQPTGGYPIVAVVIAPDLPLAAQLLPGDGLRFTLVSPEDALAAWHDMYDWLESKLAEDETAPLLNWAGG